MATRCPASRRACAVARPIPRAAPVTSVVRERRWSFVAMEFRSERGVIDELVERTFLEMLIEAPALDLLEHALELLAGDRLVDEALAAGEAAIVPFAVLEFGWDAVLPQREVLRQVGFERPLGAIQRSQVRAHLRLRRRLGHPPQRMELVGDALAKAELLRRADLPSQHARRLELL